MTASVPLNSGVGYGIVLGVGLTFALGMILTTFILRRYNSEIQTSEMFTTAGRTVKSGLVASAVVSSWTWAATLLQSTTVCYKYGVSGPIWYAAGATVQILLFATLAIQVKRLSPNAHTYLELIKARYGTAVHIVFMGFGLATNTLVSLMLIAGGSATVTSLTGMNDVAAIYLLPVGVVLYSVIGGLKATILTDYVHTFILLIIIILFSLTTYSTGDKLGSPGEVYDALKAASLRHPVAGNAEGSYLTLRSHEGAIFFVINIIGNFATVWLDNGYFLKAIAASPVHALPGYLIGGLSWFAVPFLTATTMGLAALSLENTPAFPTYPNRLSAAEVNAGLALPYAAVAILGKSGAIATLLMVFMAVTSATSAELIAVSSVVTYDFYRTYFKPTASGRRLVSISHLVVLGYMLFICTFSVGLYYAGVSMGYLYLLMGCIVSSAVIPLALTLTWSKMNKWAAGVSPVLGLACSLTAWLVTAHKECGKLTVTCTGGNNPMLAGNVTALLFPVISVPVLTYLLGPQNYNWKSMMDIRKGDDHDVAATAHTDLENIPGGAEETQEELHEENRKLMMAGKLSKWTTITMSLCLLVLWPMPMYGTGYVFSKPFFTGWVVVGIIWIFCSFIGVGLFPLWEGRKTLLRTTKLILQDVGGNKSFKSRQRDVSVNEEVIDGEKAIHGSGAATPHEATEPEMKAEF